MQLNSVTTKVLTVASFALRVWCGAVSARLRKTIGLCLFGNLAPAFPPFCSEAQSARLEITRFNPISASVSQILATGIIFGNAIMIYHMQLFIDT